jgi:hypothetical protein
LGDSQLLGKNFIHKFRHEATGEKSQTIAGKGFQGDREMLKKILARRLAIYRNKTKTR